MGILDGIAEQIGDVFGADMLGRAATYNGAACTVVLTGKGIPTAGSNGPAVADARILVLASAVPRPKRGDRVVIGTTGYRVSEVPSGDAAGATWTLDLVADMGVTL